MNFNWYTKSATLATLTDYQQIPVAQAYISVTFYHN